MGLRPIMAHTSRKSFAAKNAATKSEAEPIRSESISVYRTADTE